MTPPRGVTRGYRPASRSPLRRNEHNDPRKIEWRRRPSPSPPRSSKPDLITGEISGAQSVTSSRRSSPPIHPSRLAVIDPDERPARPPPVGPRDDLPARPTYRARSPLPSRPRSPLPTRPRSPLPVRDQSPAPLATRSPPPPARSPPRRHGSPPPRERDAPPTGPRIPPTGPAGYEAGQRNGAKPDESIAPRVPPTGPGGSRNYAQVATDVQVPTGPSALSPPTQPRGAPPGGRGGFRGDFAPRGDYQGRGRGGPFGGPWRGGRGGGPPPTAYAREQQDFSAGPPAGPRNSFSQAPPFRQGPGAPSSTYQRTARFGPNAGAVPSGPRADSAAAGGYNENTRPASNPYLADLPRVVEGGQKAPDLYDRSRVDRLEVEAENLRRAIEDKQMKKRKGLREWERLGRESEAASFRAQLADDSVRALAGDGDSGAAF